ncbi:MAG: hypothetical protein LBU14_01820 [Candidatus Peribacteria bacterium]|nr:hypothetical protein [Candidatus Peribacteria bacterium]
MASSFLAKKLSILCVIYPKLFIFCPVCLSYFQILYTEIKSNSHKADIDIKCFQFIQA